MPAHIALKKGIAPKMPDAGTQTRRWCAVLFKAALGCDFLKIYVFRHGETDWNAQHRIQGRTDIPLNENGVRQATDMGSHVAGKINPKYMIVSDLSRARDTGKIIAGFLGVDRIYTEHDLTECSYGDMDGVIVEDIYTAVCPGEEPREDASRRFLNVLKRYAEEYPEDFAVVSHGGTINAALYTITGGKMGTGQKKLKNACLSVLSYESGKFQIERCNLSPEEV